MTSTIKSVSLFVLLCMLPSVAMADSALVVVSGGKPKDQTLVATAAREALESAQWKPIDYKLPPERVAEVARCASVTDTNPRCVSSLLDEVGADRLILLSISDEQKDRVRSRIVSGSIVRRGAEALAGMQRHCEGCRDDQLADEVRVLIASMIRDARARVAPASLVVRSKPEGAHVILDARRVGATPFDSQVYAGKHTLRVEKDGYPTFSREIDIADGQRLEIDASLDRGKPRDSGQPQIGSQHGNTGESPNATTRSEPQRRSIAPWLLIGGGGAAMITGGVLIALDEDQVQGGTSVPRYNDRAPGGIVLAATGAAVAVVGGVWLWKSRHAKATVTPSVGVSSGGAALLIGGRF